MTDEQLAAIHDLCEQSRRLIDAFIKKSDRYISARDACHILDCSFPTFKQFVNEGIIPKHNGKYLESEVYSALISGKTVKYQHSKK